MTGLTRRQFLSSTSLVAMGAIPLARVARASSRARADDFVVVDTAYGKLRGARAAGVSIFRGVPYAGRVSGDRRFRRPAPLEPWTGVRDALQLGHPSIQPPNQTYGANEPLPAEDCLVLNVWTPAADGRRRPVMFYNHGGGFVTGSGGSRSQDGANLARLFDVVVVETNHRLGLLGFLYLDEVAGDAYAGSGNNGVLDIVDGLRWVHTNIAAFGGDPTNVMVFGESGGGAKTSCVYAMPGAAPYFAKASIESGPGVRMTTREAAAQTTGLLLQAMQLSARDWRRLLDVSAADLLALQLRLPQTPAALAAARTAAAAARRPRGIGPAAPGSFSPVVDGGALPHHPFDPSAPTISRDKPLMVGWNEDEYTFFAWASKDTSGFGLDLDGLRAKLTPRFGTDTGRIIDTYRASRPSASPTDIFVEVNTVTLMGLGAIEIAQKKAAQRAAPAYLYNLGYKSEVKVPGTDYPMGTPHAADIALKFDNATTPSPFSGARPERLIAARNMAELWTTFARTGRPAAAGQPVWPAYDLVRRPTMRISDVCEVIDDRHRTERELWQSLGDIG